MLSKKGTNMTTTIKPQSAELKELVLKTNLKHIAIIMDGNRRWAKEKHLPTAAGHSEGVKSLKRTVISAQNAGVKTLTVYAFSTENWQRKKEEVDFLMQLLAKTWYDVTVSEDEADAIGIGKYVAEVCARKNDL